MTAGFERQSGAFLHLEALLSLQAEGLNRLGIVQGAMQLGVEALGQRLDGIGQRLGGFDGRLEGFDRRLGHLFRKWMEQGTVSLELLTTVTEEERSLRVLLEKLSERCKELEAAVARLEAERDAG